MKSAVYYPHTELRRPNVLKTALLLGGKLEFITPFDDKYFHVTDCEMQEGLELIGHNHFPTSEQKQEAHAVIEDLITGELPEGFFYQGEAVNRICRHGMWPQKLLPETWQMLIEMKVVGQRYDRGHYPLEDSAGLALMSILAECCAGKTKTRITDRGIAYAALANMMVTKARRVERQYDAVVPITLKIIDTSDILLRNLLDFRKKK